MLTQTPPMSSRGPDSARTWKQPWSVNVADNLKLYALQLTSTAGSSALAKTATAPLDRVKVLLQVQGACNIPPSERYKGPWDVLRGIARQEGRLAYFRGNGASVLRLFPDVSLRFFLHEQFKLLLAPAPGAVPAPRWQGKLAASWAMGLVSTVALYPLQLAHTRLVADRAWPGHPRTYQGLFHCITQTRRLEGLQGLYRGLGLSAACLVPYLAVSFALYDELKAALPADKASRKATWYPLAKVGAGATASLTALVVTYPADTVRRRVQVCGSPGHMRPSSAWSCARHLLATEGWRGFYRGLGAGCLRTVPGAVVQFLVYDLLKTGLFWLDREGL